MPRYFFDTSDGGQSSTDDEGIEVSDHEAARREALAALPDMARDGLPDGDRHEFNVRVRDEAGNTIYTASLTLDGGWQV